MSQLDELCKKLTELSKQFIDRDHELLVLAEKCSPKTLLNVSESLLKISRELETCGYNCINQSDLNDQERNSKVEDFRKNFEKKDAFTKEHMLELVAWAAELNFEQQELNKQASVLDQVLRNFGLNINDQREEFYQSMQAKIAELKEEKNKLYNTEEQIKKSFRGDQAAKAVDEQIKQYRPMEHSLQTRTCPDHAGALLQRIGDNVYQCSLDKKVFDFKNGFSTEKGSKVPGTDVALQSKVPQSTLDMQPAFSTRKERTG